MQLALLGNGNEFIQLARGLVNGGHRVTHIGPVNMSNQTDQQILANELGAKLVLDHIELVNDGIRDIIMCSYAPLIEMNVLQRARFYNIHYALLPRFRGMHGLVWGIINDEKEVGYTLHLVDDGIDSGPIYHQGKVLIKEDDDIITLRNKIDQLLYKEIGTIFQKIENGELKAVEQRHSLATYGTRRTEADSEINWKWPARRIFNIIRALTPPYTSGAFTYYKDKKLIIDVTAKSQKSRISKQEKPYRIAKYYRENRRNTTINQKFGGFSNCLSQIMIIFKEKYLAISSGSTPL
ncbi:methionyl-tRNA formyltransferase [Syntrophomonas wolfei]|uniref:Methionyl-tRNA formyltransferase-like protein n=1 Tax=Syntrophomonas wolfei subsp. wolfei (strain DSM 2245B / Goettingen) TaxID=335541 RepID=Q0AZ13_SYNWW|nr:formyltransferase family protein [Syntrophomonas wolfei]ABI68041.1 Methionyl-tRNA formyltransferase-like protein [Syntrophomonas wolfei subsp. wolfei str. Goettingen G311]